MTNSNIEKIGFSGTSQHDIERAVGETLYTYRKPDSFTELIVTNQELYFSSPISFNDPFECYVIEDEKDKEDKYENLIRQGILCLSVAKPEEKTLMWSHYADKHKGLCFEFDKKQFQLFYKNYDKNEEKKQIDKECCKIKKVDYQTENAVQLLTKDKSWEYEEEYRIILHYEIIKKNKHQREFVFDKLCLKKIYFGVNASLDTIDRYKLLCTKHLNDETHKVELFKMKLAGRYLMKAKEIEY